MGAVEAPRSLHGGLRLADLVRPEELRRQTMQSIRQSVRFATDHDIKSQDMPL